MSSEQWTSLIIYEQWTSLSYSFSWSVVFASYNYKEDQEGRYSLYNIYLFFELFLILTETVDFVHLKNSHWASGAFAVFVVSLVRIYNCGFQTWQI